MNISTEVTTVPIAVAELAGGDNKSEVFPLNRFQRAKLQVRTSGNPSAGQWVLKSVPEPDNSINGEIIATANFSATLDVTGETVEICDLYGYVQQITPIADGDLESVSVYLMN